MTSEQANSDSKGHQCQQTRAASGQPALPAEDPARREGAGDELTKGKTNNNKPQGGLVTEDRT